MYILFIKNVAATLRVRGREFLPGASKALEFRISNFSLGASKALEFRISNFEFRQQRLKYMGSRRSQEPPFPPFICVTPFGRKARVT